MANEQRQRANFRSGTITDNPMLVGAATFNSAALAALEDISATEHMAITLDPTGVGNGPEIVHITDHDAGATVASVLRAREGTSAVQHASGTIWAATPLVSDVVTIVADAASLPANPWLYQMCMIANTGGVVVYYGPTTGWRPPWNMAWGATLGGTDTDELVADGAGFTTIADLGAEVTLPASWPAGRKVRIEAYATVQAFSTASQVEVIIREGSTEHGLGTETIAAAGQSSTVLARADIVPGAGAHTYKLSGRANTLAFINASATPTGANAPGPTKLTIEDRGPNANPVLT